MMTEKEIREKINELEYHLECTEETWDEYVKSPDDSKRYWFYHSGEKARTQRRAYSIENQLYALYLVLGEEYKFKH